MAISDELCRLHELHKSGALTDDEFQKAKDMLLSGPTVPCSTASESPPTDQLPIVAGPSAASSPFFNASAGFDKLIAPYRVQAEKYCRFDLLLHVLRFIYLAVGGWISVKLVIEILLLDIKGDIPARQFQAHMSEPATILKMVFILGFVLFWFLSHLVDRFFDSQHRRIENEAMRDFNICYYCGSEPRRAIGVILIQKYKERVGVPVASAEFEIYRALRDEAEAARKAIGYPMAEELRARILSLLGEGKELEAVKAYRAEIVGSSFAEAEEAVASISPK